MKPRKSLDWPSVRAQLERSRAAMDRVSDPERIERIFRQRAARLAQRVEAPHDRRGELAVLIFSLGADRYGLQLSEIGEVVSQPRWAPVPGAPAQLAGVLQARGEIRPVWRLARLLGLPDSSEPGLGCVLLLRGDHAFGLLVDRVEEVRNISRRECGPAREGAPYVKYTTADLLVILNPEELLKEVVS